MLCRNFSGGGRRVGYRHVASQRPDAYLRAQRRVSRSGAHPERLAISGNGMTLIDSAGRRRVSPIQINGQTGTRLGHHSAPGRITYCLDKSLFRILRAN